LNSHPSGARELRYAVRAQYQYVLLAGHAPRAVALVEEGARSVGASGDVTVYRVEPAAPPTALTRLSE
jgi:hypothetical protein